MHLSQPLLLLTSILTLTTAFPTNSEVPRACGTKIFPTLYTLKESDPNTASPALPPFTVSQDISSTGTKYNRIYTVAHFSDTSFLGSWGCTLHLNIPSTTVLNTYGSAALNVQIVSWPAAGTFTPTWSSVSSLIQPGVFGTVTATSGGDSYVNSGVCPAAGTTSGLTYVFETVDYVAINAGVNFAVTSGVGPYLTFGC